MSQTDLQNIDRMIRGQPDITIHEIWAELQLRISDEAIRKAVVKLEYVYKKKSLHALEQERPRRQAQTEGVERTYVNEWRR